MTRHKIATRPRNGGYLAACRDCDAITFGGFPTRTAAREALAGHDHEEAPGAVPAAAEGKDTETDTHERPDSMNTITTPTTMRDWLAPFTADLALVPTCDYAGHPTTTVLELTSEVFSRTHVITVLAGDAEVSLAPSPDPMTAHDANSWATELLFVAWIADDIASKPPVEVAAIIATLGNGGAS